VSAELVRCQECGAPWGVILDRGKTPDVFAEAFARADMLEAWLEDARCDEGDDAAFLTERLPDVKPIEVIYLSAGLVSFASEHGFGDVLPEDAAWMEVDWLDLPAWLLKGRKRRWSYRWDCCNIGWPSN
jgi:hypothetical protein